MPHEIPATPRVAHALVFAQQKHHGQCRKGSAEPYITHPQAVAQRVATYGGDEDQVIAALLHDTVEDCGGEPVLDEIRQQFGDEIAVMVEGLTEAAPLAGQPKPPWEPRKRAYLDRLASLPQRVRLVSLCDKIDNVISIQKGLATQGLRVFELFKMGQVGTLWFYRTYADTMRTLGPAQPATDLDQLVTKLEQQVATWPPK